MCSSEKCTICCGLWWRRALADPGAHVESPRGAVAAKLVPAGSGRFNLHCRGCSILFAFLNILYYFLVNLNSPMSLESVWMQLISCHPGDFRQLHSEPFRKLFNHLGKSYGAKKSCVYLLPGCKLVVQNIAAPGCKTAHKPPLKSQCQKKKQTKELTLCMQ